MAKIVIDAGHGGQEPGALYDDRREKDDTLRLALAVGDILEQNGVDVAYTRTEDVYNTPFEKAQIANREGGDFLVSLHRNASPESNQYSGVETLVYDDSGQKAELARAINQELEQVGFRNLGVKERPGLVILRRSTMPAVLVEAGFLNTDADNELFDNNFQEIAQAIANGILQTLYAADGSGSEGAAGYGSDAGSGMLVGYGSDAGSSALAGYGGDVGSGAGAGYGDGNGEMKPVTGMNDRFGHWPGGGPSRYYSVQAGAFRNRQYAEELLYQLLQQNFPAFILREDNYYKVQVGAFRQLENAVRMEETLRRCGYSTFITT